MKSFSSGKSKGLLFVIAAIVTASLAVMIVVSIGSKMSPSVAALEANQDIKIGTPLDRSMFNEVMLAEASVPSQLVDTNIDFTGLIASKDISTGDIFREPAILSLEGNLALFSARLSVLNDPSLRAVEIPTDSVEGLITGMGPQDSVDLVAVYKELEIADGFSAVAEDTLTSKTIVRGAPVLGVKAGDSENVEGTPSTLLIVALNEEQIEDLALYAELGNIYASLRPFGVQGLKNIDGDVITEESDTEEAQDNTEKQDNGLEKIGDVDDIDPNQIENTEDIDDTEDIEDTEENLDQPVSSEEEEVESDD